jgi:hypothetical protein
MTNPSCSSSLPQDVQEAIATLLKEAGHNEVEWDINRSFLRDVADLLSRESSLRIKAEQNLAETHKAWDNENELRRDAEEKLQALKEERRVANGHES